MAGTILQQSNTGQLVLPVPGHPSNVRIPSGSFVRPADTTTYASGDLVANSTTAGAVVPISMQATDVTNGTGFLRRCMLRKSGTGVTNAQFRVHVYQGDTIITCANGDNGIWSTNQVDNYLGSFDVTVDKAFTDGASGVGVPTNGFELSFKAAGTVNLQFLLEARGAYTPGSAEVFTLSFEDWM
jgi:hypothetical protein